MDMPQDSDVSRETSLNLRLDLSSFSKSNSITNDTPSFNVLNSTEIDTNVTKSLLDFNEIVKECTTACCYHLQQPWITNLDAQ